MQYTYTTLKAAKASRAYWRTRAKTSIQVNKLRRGKKSYTLKIGYIR